MSSDEANPLDAAEALAGKAWQADEDDGPAVALNLYQQVVGLLQGADDSASKALSAWALNAISRAHQDLGNHAESRAVALELVEKHFDDSPREMFDVVVPDATLRLAAFLDNDGNRDDAIALMRRLIDRYGPPGVLEHRLTAAVAHGNIGRILDDQGHRDDARREFRAVIALLGQSDDDEARALVAESGEPMARLALAHALASEAEFLYADNRHVEADARLQSLVDRFASAGDPQIIQFVTWALETLKDSRRYRRRRRFRLRR